MQTRLYCTSCKTERLFDVSIVYDLQKVPIALIFTCIFCGTSWREEINPDKLPLLLQKIQQRKYNQEEGEDTDDIL